MDVQMGERAHTAQMYSICEVVFNLGKEGLNLFKIMALARSLFEIIEIIAFMENT